MIIKRFIAGAVCPSCKAMDKTQLQRSEFSQKIECVSCGYSQTQSQSQAITYISEETSKEQK